MAEVLLTGQQIELPNGRMLGYDEHGPSGGKLLLYFHGTPSSRKEWLLFGEGHTSLIVNHAEEILQTLVASAYDV